MICEKCFKQIDDDSSFCIYCGANQTISENYNKENLIIYSHNKKFGFKDKNTLEIVVPLKYDFIGNFSDDRAVVMINFKYGYVDKNGKEITRLKYDFAKESKNGYSPVKRDDKWSIIDKNCKEICPFKYDSIEYFVENLALVSIDKKFSLINKNGEEITKKFYDNIDEFNENIALVKLNEKFGGIDDKGSEIIPLNYDSIEKFMNQIFKVKQNEKIGLLDNNGKIILACSYDNIQKFTEYAVKLNNLNKMGFFFFISGITLHCDYDECKILNDEIIAISKDSIWKAFNKLGEDVSDKNESFLKFKNDIINRKRKKSRIITIVTILSFILFVIIMDAVSGNIGIIKESKILIEGKENFIWNEYRDTHNIQILYSYLKKYPNGKYKIQADIIIENKTWKADNKNYTVDSFRDYLRKYPNGRYASIAKDNIRWLPVMQVNTIWAYENYIKKYHQGFHVTEAKKMMDELLWNNAIKYNTNYYYQYYLSNAPVGTHRIDAMIKLKNFESLEDAQNYLVNNPNGIYSGKALSTFESKGIQYYVFKVGFYINNKNYTWDTVFNQDEINTMRPRVKLISTMDSNVEIAYKTKHLNGDFPWYLKYGGNTSFVKNGREMVYERVNLHKGVNDITFSMSYNVGSWEKGTNIYEIYLNGKLTYKQTLIIK